MRILDRCSNKLYISSTKLFWIIQMGDYIVTQEKNMAIDKQCRAASAIAPWYYQHPRLLPSLCYAIFSFFFLVIWLFCNHEMTATLATFGSSSREKMKKKKKSYNLSVDTEKTFDKIQHSFMIRILNI